MRPDLGSRPRRGRRGRPRVRGAVRGARVRAPRGDGAGAAVRIGSPAILHLSDVHLVPRKRPRAAVAAHLADTEPDLVVNTGDNLAHNQAVPRCWRAYGDLLDLPGVFVFGSNDYYSPILKNPARYLLRRHRVRQTGHRGGPKPRISPSTRLRRAFTDRGWIDLTNRHASLDGRRPPARLRRRRRPAPRVRRARRRARRRVGRSCIGVAHAPYLRVLDRWNALGYPLILAGHTHGGSSACRSSGRS